MTNAKIAKLHADLERAEAKLARAFTKWQKLRAQVKRVAAKHEKELMGKTDIGGEHDERDMAEAAGIIPKPWPVKTHKVTNVPVRQPRKYRGK